MSREMPTFDIPTEDEVPRLRIPPHSVEAEQSVLGALIVDNAAWDQVGDMVEARDFYRHEHQLVFAAIGGLLNACRPADVITVAEELRAIGKLEAVGGHVYLHALSSSVPSARNARRYAETVREKGLLRSMVALSDEAATAAFNPQGQDARDIASSFAQRFVDLQSATVRQMPQAVADLIAAQCDRYNALHEGTAEPAMSTGLPDIDDALTGGLRPGKVYVIAARPSVGKSSLAQHIALGCAGKGHPVLMLSQEMAKPEVMDRAIANLGSIDYEHLQTGKLADDEWGKLSETVTFLGSLPFWIDDQAGLTLRDIRAKAVSLRQQGLKVLVIDYLQLSNFEKQKGESTNDAVGTMSKGIKRMAMELGLAVILLSQLNRDVEKRTSPEPWLSDLRDSGAIEQDADVILLLWKCRTWSDRLVMGLTFAKNRAGKFKGRLALEFFGEFQQWICSDADINPDKKAAKAAEDFE